MIQNLIQFNSIQYDNTFSSELVSTISPFMNLEEDEILDLELEINGILSSWGEKGKDRADFDRYSKRYI